MNKTTAKMHPLWLKNKREQPPTIWKLTAICNMCPTPHAHTQPGEYNAKKTLVNAHSATTVVIPNNIEYISAKCFRNNGQLRKIFVSDKSDLVCIGEHAFYACYGLREFRSPPKLYHISMGAFEGCVSLKYLYLNDACEYISSRAFNACRSLESISIGTKMKCIEDNAFKNCVNLRVVEIASPIVKITARAFNGCKKMKYIILHKTVHQYDRIFEEIAEFAPDCVFEYIDNTTIPHTTCTYYTSDQCMAQMANLESLS